jgi:general secretion pathway protein H
MAATASPVAMASTVTTVIGNSAAGEKGSGSFSSPSVVDDGSMLRRKMNLTPFRGFTLIEMLAVIVLIAIAVTVTAVSLHGRARGELDAAAQGIAAGLRDTRTRAMATGKPQWFTLDLHRHTWTTPGRDPRVLPAQATLDVTAAKIGASQPGIARIGFFPDGSSSGGHITLSEPHLALRVNVDWLTGAVSVMHGAQP